MTSSDKSSLESEVRRAAMDARLYPALELEVSVPSGAAVPFRLYRGDHVDQMVEEFAKAHGETEKSMILKLSVCFFFVRRTCLCGGPQSIIDPYACSLWSPKTHC